MKLSPLKLAEKPDAQRPSGPWRPLASPDEEASAIVDDPTQARIRELERMLEEMRSRKELAEREAFEKAFAAGEQAGMQVGRKRAEQLLAEIEALRREVVQMLETLRSELADAAVEFIQTLASQLLGEALGQPEQLRAAIEQALSELPEAQKVVVAVSPTRREMLQEMFAGHEAIERIVVDGALKNEQARIVLQDGALLLDLPSAVREAIRRLQQ